MISSKRMSGQLVLALAALFALFLFAGCEEEEAGPNAATQAGIGSAEVLGAAIGTATNAPASMASLNANGGSADDHARALLSGVSGATPLMSSPLDMFTGTLTDEVVNCPANGTVTLNGSASWDHDFDQPPLGYGTYTASVNNLNAAFANCSNFFHRFNGSAMLDADHSFSRTQLSGSNDHWEFSASNEFSGSIAARDNQTLVVYEIDFDFSESGNIEFNYNTNTDIVTNSVLTYSMTITVNGQTCAGNVTVIGPNQQQASWSCF